MGRHTLIAIRMALLTMLGFGIVYPLAMTGAAQALFPRQANGSLLRRGGVTVGSALIGQQFMQPGYFHPRPSAAGEGYDAASSGGSNLGPTSSSLAFELRERAGRALQDCPGMGRGRIPPDMITASASGLDPDISPANAFCQAPRVARARGMTVARVQYLVASQVVARPLGFLGEPRVNVLRLNLTLDASAGVAR